MELEQVSRGLAVADYDDDGDLDVALNNSLAHVLFKEGFVDEEHIRHFASGSNLRPRASTVG